MEELNKPEEENEIYPVAKVRLKSEAILFENIQEGFENYEYFILEGGKEAYKKFLMQSYEINGQDGVFGDFYYSSLGEAEKESFRQGLAEKGHKFYMPESWGQGVYYCLTKEGLSFLADITLDEILLSTFYFTKFACTIWGNYGLKFPCFFRDKYVKDKYKDLALNCGLRISK